MTSRSGEVDLSALGEWVGRAVTETDVVTLGPVRRASALFDVAQGSGGAAEDLPAGWHWFFFNPATPQSDIGADGHPLRGGFLPPIPLPRRMWAAGRLTFQGPLRVGDHIERRSRIAAIEAKRGRSGPLVFVTVQHSVHGPTGPAVEEEQTLVYRRAPGRDEPRAESEQLPSDLEWDERYVPTAVALFRFSALTFNGHRIHYDHPYATEVEGYRGLLVHAPFAALLLLSAAQRHGEGRPHIFSFRNVGPLFGGEEITIAGRTASADRIETWAANADGLVSVRATLHLVPS